MGDDSCELPSALRAFLASPRTLDDLLSPKHYRGGGEVARQLEAANATWVASGRHGAAPVKACPEVAAALSSGSTPAAPHAAPSLDRLVQLRLEPVLRALRALARSADRQRITTELMLACLAKLEPAAGAPDFRIDRYGLAVSPFAVSPSPFACHMDHRLPVACGGATDGANLEAVQHRFNHCKRDSIIDPQLHGSHILSQMEPHSYVTAAQLQELAAVLRAEGQEPSYQNVTARLRRTPPWSLSDSSSSGGSSSMAAHTEASRMAAGRRKRQEWSHEEELALAWAAAPHALAALSGGGRIPWCTVAVKVGNGRSATQCKEKWRRLLQHPAALRNEEQEGSTEEEEEEEAQQQQRRRPAQDYEPWSGGEMDDAAALLGAVGARLAGDAGFALAARSFPEKLEAACRELWGASLAERLPGCSRKQVVDKCRGMVEFALKLARNKLVRSKVKFSQPQDDRPVGLTPQQWERLAPHLLRLAEALPLRAGVASLVASEADRAEVRRFLEDPPLGGVKDLRPLHDYWQPPQRAPAAAPPGAAAAAAAAAAAQAQPAAAAAACGTAGAAEPAQPAAAAAASSLAEGIIDLTLSDSDDDEKGVIDLTLADSDDDQGAQASGRPAGVVGRRRAPPAAPATAQHGQDGSSGGQEGSSGGRGAAAERRALAAVQLPLQQQQPSAAAPTGRREYRKPTEAQRELIFQLWLHHGNRWERIRQEADQAGALVDWADCRTKTEAQTKIKDMARNWRNWEQAGRQQERRQRGTPAAAT